MRIPIFISTLLALATLPTLPAAAIDCSLASTPMDKLICSNAGIKSDDAALNAAYSALLGTVKDKGVRDLLIASQRRWLKELNDQFDWPDIYGDTGINDTDKARLVSQEMQSRTNEFNTKENRFSILKNIEQQQKFAGQYTGGTYAGYDIQCFFAPVGFGDGDYVCTGTETFQNNERICRTNTEWASGHTTEHRTVAAVAGDSVKMIATCAIGNTSTDEPCEANDSPAHWNMKPAITDDTPAFKAPNQGPLLKFDPDVSAKTSEEDPWLRACLTDQKYPQAPATP